ncbi:Iron-uptake system permease protein FeuC [Paraliobacillus sp. PM-2]|uniref:FecCD family ABC transporter permease n=1 Tax=Paraliobacillus sp. PM-2 TaxID=1462524 RepID=UPI00061C773A|nr:iron ABC transporter permease [Paraliobacillus sp. PM-2]CQR48421.1 Iron-uptake system permease protein FeuC [Paraliobacillus sp. PM-2]
MIHPSIIKKQRIILLFLFLAIICAFFISIALGYASLPVSRLLPTLFGQGTMKEEFILFTIRLPRVLITILAGIALATSGAILQGITKNDLADPGIIGINAGSGVAIAIFFLFFPVEAGAFVYLLPVIAFLGACLTAIVIFKLSYQKNQGLQPVKFVLMGVGISMALSGVMIVIISSAERAKVDFIASWLAGNIWGGDWPFILAMLPWMLVLLPFVLYKANRLNILTLHDHVSVGLGINKSREQFVLIGAAVALAAAAVSVTGGIAFVGLMAPHIAKSLVGPRFQLFLPVAMLLGGLLLLIADTIGRNVLEPDGIAAGIVTALIGAPYFIYLLIK